MWFVPLGFSEKIQIRRAYFDCMTFDVVNIVVTVWTLEVHRYNPKNKYSELFGFFPKWIGCENRFCRFLLQVLCDPNIARFWHWNVLASLIWYLL